MDEENLAKNDPLDLVQNMQVDEDGNIRLEIGDTVDLLDFLEQVSILDEEHKDVSLIVLPGLFTTCAEEIRSLRQKVQDLESELQDSLNVDCISIQDSNGEEIATIDGDLATFTIKAALEDYIHRLLRYSLKNYFSETPKE